MVDQNSSIKKKNTQCHSPTFSGRLVLRHVLMRPVSSGPRLRFHFRWGGAFTRREEATRPVRKEKKKKKKKGKERRAILLTTRVQQVLRRLPGETRAV
ncbi:hypothetical protein AMELA_G00024160 [Ameiurus melas]|uniref:Uncharacterized protein n=1 Tax=Ameiurus melas TaxID=219545 RepID=A0A7J6BCC6_AMEME|nr:hypothetical protein AMELA_G00024160 [Ameiurus melas]